MADWSKPLRVRDKYHKCVIRFYKCRGEIRAQFVENDVVEYDIWIPRFIAPKIAGRLYSGKKIEHIGICSELDKEFNSWRAKQYYYG